MRELLKLLAASVLFITTVVVRLKAQDPQAALFKARWDSLNNRLTEMSYSGNAQAANEAADALLELCSGVKEDSLKMIVFSQKASVVFSTEEADLYSNKSLEIARRLRSNKWVTNGLNNLALLYFQIGDIGQAYKYTCELQRFADSTQYEKARVMATMNFAQLYSRIGEYEKSSYYFNNLIQALEVQKKPQEGTRNLLAEMRIIQAHLGVGRNYAERGMPDSSLLFLNNALIKSLENGQMAGLTLQCYLELANYYGNQTGNAAILYMQAALDSSKVYLQAQDPLTGPYYTYLREKLQILRGNSRVAVQNILPLYEDSRKTEDWAAQKNYLELLYKASAQCGNNKAALKYFQDLNLLEDSIKMHQIHEKIEIYQIDRQIAEKELENLKFQKKAEAIAFQSKLTSLTAISTILIMCLLGVALWRTRRQKQKIERLNFDLNTVNKKLSQYFSTVSHDLLSRIDLILSFGNVLGGQHAPKNNLLHYYRETHSLAKSMKAYCTQLVEERKSHILNKEGNNQLHDPTPVIKTVLDAYHVALEESKFEVFVEKLPPSKLPPVIVEHLFQNLITNSIRYSKGAASPKIHISGRQDIAAKRITWIYEDNGPGMGKQADKNDYLKASEQAFESITGFGIGLSLVEETLKDYGAQFAICDRQHENGINIQIIQTI